MTTVRSSFVLISEDVLLARALASAISGAASLIVVSSVEEALALIRATRHLSGIVLEQTLLGADVPRLLNKLRAASPLASLLLVAGKLDASMINTLQPLRVQLTVRPFPLDALTLYVSRALAGGRVSTADVQGSVARLSRAHGLSAGDRALMPVLLDVETAELACQRLGLEGAALERGLRRIVKKCRVRNIDRLARQVWSDALLYGREDSGHGLEPPKIAAAT